MTRRGSGQMARVGVVAHPGAGAGMPALETALEGVFEAIVDATVVAAAGSVEAAVAARIGSIVEEVPKPSPGEGSFPVSVAEAIVGHDVDVMLAAGGDGTLAAVANILALHGKDAPPLVGIGTGSANVGPLVTALGGEVGNLDWRQLAERAVDGVRYAVGGEQLGIAFNDVVFSNTFFGMLYGARVDLDARAMLAGRRQTASPAAVCGPRLRVWKNGHVVLSGQQMRISQLVICPVNDSVRFLGTAASGFLSWGPYVGCPAVLAAGSSLLIRTQLRLDDLLAAEPLQLFHVAFGQQDEVVVEGLCPGAVLVADGTPVVEISPSARVVLTLAKEAVRVLRGGTR